MGEYVPPQRLNPSAGGATSIVLNDYDKAGDKVTFALGTATKRVHCFAVDTYLDRSEEQYRQANGHLRYAS